MKEKKTVATVVLVCMLVAGVCLGAGAQEGTEAPGTYNGYLFCKLENIGTKSEGPSYFLQRWDGSEVHILKNGILWQRDARLDEHLNTKVTISGTMEDGHLRYTGIEPFRH